MPTTPAAADLFQAALLGLRGVSTKRLFGDQAFFVAGRMFAFRREGTVVLKLPELERKEVLDGGYGRPFLTGAHATFGRWVEVKLKDTRTAIGLALIAHAAARVPDRAGPKKRRRRTVKA